MNIRGPIIDPRGTTNTISRKLLYFKFIFVCCFLFDTQLCTSSNAVKLKPYAFSFAMSNSWSRQSKAFNKFVSKAPNILLLSTDLFHFSNIARRHCWVLKPFRNPHWYFENIFVKNCDICSDMHFSSIFDKFGRVLTGL